MTALQDFLNRLRLNSLAFRLSGDFRKVDLLLLTLFAVIGVQGYSRFPSYQSSLQNLESIPCYWVILVATFNFLLIYKKIRVCYLEDALGYAAAFIVYSATSVLLQLLLWAIVDGYDILTCASILATQAGLATLLLIVQGWFAFSPDLTVVRREMKLLTSSMEALSRSANQGQIERTGAQGHCAKLQEELSKVLSDSRVSNAITARLNNLKELCAEIDQSLKKPTGALQTDIQNLLPRLKNG